MDDNSTSNNDTEIVYEQGKQGKTKLMDNIAYIIFAVFVLVVILIIIFLCVRFVKRYPR